MLLTEDQLRKAIVDIYAYYYQVAKRHASIHRAVAEVFRNLSVMHGTFNSAELTQMFEHAATLATVSAGLLEKDIAELDRRAGITPGEISDPTLPTQKPPKDDLPC